MSSPQLALSVASDLTSAPESFPEQAAMFSFALGSDRLRSQPIADFRGSCEIEGYRDLERIFRAIMRSETLCHGIEKFRHQCSPKADVS